MTEFILQLFITGFNVLFILILIWVISSWLVAFGVLDPSIPVVGQVIGFLNSIFDPILAPIRRVMPDLGGIDLSPIVLIIGLQILQRILIAALT